MNVYKFHVISAEIKITNSHYLYINASFAHGLVHVIRENCLVFLKLLTEKEAQNRHLLIPYQSFGLVSLKGI